MPLYKQSLSERAADIYCEAKGLEPGRGIRNIRTGQRGQTKALVAMEMEDLRVRLACLETARREFVAAKDQTRKFMSDVAPNTDVTAGPVQVLPWWKKTLNLAALFRRG